MKTFSETAVQTLWATMCKRYKCKLKPKSGSWVMKIVAKIFDRRHKKNENLMSGEAFMETVWTTHGNTIYYPSSSKPGHGDDDELRSQVELACHECIHVMQRPGIKYLTSPARIAKIESDAFIASMEAHHWITGAVMFPSHLAAKLAAYGCNEEQIDYARKKYMLIRNMVERGEYRSPTVRTAIEVLGS